MTPHDVHAAEASQPVELTPEEAELSAQIDTILAELDVGIPRLKREMEELLANIRGSAPAAR